MSTRTQRMLAEFEMATVAEARRCKRRLKAWRQHGGIMRAIAFDHAAEALQIALHRETAARKLNAEVWS